MNENTCLIKKQRNLEQQEANYDNISLNLIVKIILFIFGFIFCPLVLYFLIFYLPTKYIPEVGDLKEIQKIAALNITYAPLSIERSVELGLYKDLAIEPDYKKTSYKLDIDILNKDEELDLSNTKERLIMIGDIHAHLNEFKKLLTKVKFNQTTDYLLMLGDFISKGPDSIDVLDFAIENNFDCVLGNHEYSILQNYAKFHRLHSPVFLTSESSETFLKNDFSNDPEFKIAKKLLPKHIAFLNKCSVMKKLGKVPVHDWSKKSKSYSLTEGVAVHAGIRWDLSLEEQNPIDNLEMRAYIGPYYNETSNDDSRSDAVTWPKIYNKKQEQKDKSNEETLVVYYAHYARKGLTLKKYSKGLDSGCHAGNYLSAIIIWNEVAINKKGKKVVHYKEKIAQVKCY